MFYVLSLCKHLSFVLCACYFCNLVVICFTSLLLFSALQMVISFSHLHCSCLLTLESVQVFSIPLVLLYASITCLPPDNSHSLLYHASTLSWPSPLLSFCHSPCKSDYGFRSSCLRLFHLSINHDFYYTLRWYTGVHQLYCHLVF